MGAGRYPTSVRGSSSGGRGTFEPGSRPENDDPATVRAMMKAAEKVRQELLQHEGSDPMEDDPDTFFSMFNNARDMQNIDDMNARFMAEQRAKGYPDEPSGPGEYFGGGGAGPHWNARKPQGSVGISGDTACSNGSKRAWKFLRYGGACAGQIFGPHDNAEFSVFYGVLPRTVWRPSCTLSYSGWQQVWNYGATAESPVAYFPTGAPIDCATNGTGICDLPDPSTNDVYAEFYANPAVNSTSGGLDEHNVTVGNLWRARTIPCISHGQAYQFGRIPWGPHWKKARAPRGSQPPAPDRPRPERERYPRDFEARYDGKRWRFEEKPWTGRSEPPPGRTKEPKRKPQLYNLPGVRRVLNAWGTFTEIEDVVDAIHDALPRRCREKPWQPDGSKTHTRHKLDNIYRCFGEIDIGLALENILNNEIEDAWYGLILGRGGKAVNRALGLPTGGARLIKALVDVPGAPRFHNMYDRHERFDPWKPGKSRKPFRSRRRRARRST